ncbi:MAG: hypothetical protein M3457_16215 [Chloroflexota bacterium]|nr:hypothetical protein [Chloroflexota bacterium]
MIDLHGLASFIKIRNVVDGEITRLIGRPAHSGHLGEYVASAIFDIELEPTANKKAIDGTFRSGTLAGRTVNIKFGTRKHGMMNLVASAGPAQHPDYYLVLTGSGKGAVPAENHNAPWVIRQVLLFEANDLLEKLALKGVKLGVGTSVSSDLWMAAMIYLNR